MPPDFDKNTIDTIAKRAGFICSNPDCRVKTVGPNTEAEKSIIIGEAAHIYGARPISKRYKEDMNDTARAEITNAIWLCRNCHKIIDSDDKKFSSNVLFHWRELHEKLVLSELGNKSDLIEGEEQDAILNQFKEYPFIIKRIIIDKPLGWEFRLTSELMRFFNSPHLRRLKDLQNNLYLRHRQHLVEADVLNWVQSKLKEMSNLTPPIVNLIQKLNLSWGVPGQDGDIDEIHHTCLLIRDYIEHIIQFEELLHFTSVPEKYEKLKLLLQQLVGSQLLKIEDIPKKLDNIVALLNKRVLEQSKDSITIHEALVFELPENWETEFNRELRKIQGVSFFSNQGCAMVFAIITISLIFLKIIF